MKKEYRVDFSEYDFMADDGTYIGNLDFKMYGKKDNIVAYITLENGEKIIAVAYKDKDYYGFEDIDVDSNIEITFEKSGSGMIRLSQVNVL